MAKTKKNVAAIQAVRERMYEALTMSVMYEDHNKTRNATRLKYWVGTGNKEATATEEAEVREVLKNLIPEMEEATGCKLEYYFRTALTHSWHTHSDYPERFLYIWVPDPKEVAA